MRTSKIVLFGLLTCIVSAGSSSASLYAYSYFDQGAEGWVSRALSSPLHYVHSGGYPGGFVSATVPEDEPFSYFYAPAAYLGNQSAALDGVLRFQLRLQEPVLRPGFYGSVFLERDGKSIFHSISMPTNDWTAYDLALSSASGWSWSVLCKQASEEDLRYFLSDLDNLYIQRTCLIGGGTAGDLDNVALATDGVDVAEVPEPSILVLLLAVGGGALIARRRRAS